MTERRVDSQEYFRPTRALSVVIVPLFLVLAASQFTVPWGEGAVYRPASAIWGMNGHRVVAAIAERHLLPITRLRITELIGPYSLAQIGNWADWYRGRPEGQHTATWHYVNIPPGEEYAEPDSETPRDLVQAMRLQERILGDAGRSREERAVALKLLVHFIGDAHQPLHAGYAADRGGNLVQVRWFGMVTNLHSVWDSHLVEHQRLSYTEYVDFLDFASAEDIGAWSDSRYLDWIEESRALLNQAYAPIRSVEQDEIPDLGWDYVNAMTPVFERRLLQGGIRLAGVLNRVLGGVVRPAPEH
jgi:hypothetical protein